MPAIVEPSDDRRHRPRCPPFGSETQKKRNKTKERQGNVDSLNTLGNISSGASEERGRLFLLVVNSTQIAEPLNVRFFEIRGYKPKYEKLKKL